MYAARAGWKTVLYERGLPGGQAATTDRLENYPGFPEGVGGPELMMAFADQAARFGMETEYAEVRAIDLENKRLTLEDGEAQALSLIHIWDGLLKFAAMDIKKLALHKWRPFLLFLLFSILSPPFLYLVCQRSPFAFSQGGFFDRLNRPQDMASCGLCLVPPPVGGGTFRKAAFYAIFAS